MRGFANYFRIAQVKTLFKTIMNWIHRRRWMKQMREWKSWKGLHKQLHRIGYKGSFEKISMTRWRNASCHLIHKAFPLQYLNTNSQKNNFSPILSHLKLSFKQGFLNDNLTHF